MDIDSIVTAATKSPYRRTCPVCALTGEPAEAIRRLEDIQREQGPDAVNKAAIAANPEWEKTTGIGVDAIRTHFRKHL